MQLDGFISQIGCKAPVASGLYAGQCFIQISNCSCSQIILILSGVILDDLDKFFCIIVFKMKELLKAGFQAWVALQQPFHFIGIAGKDDNQIFIMLCHFINQCVDGFFAKIPRRFT
ncbi:Uncharacterised protein [Mycobacteroides abscessus subsp. abscessus]|nr:Uncharacterised protein [Mycobacteroides abscessus subsp. abscessus]